MSDCRTWKHSVSRCPTFGPRDTAFLHSVVRLATTVYTWLYNAYMWSCQCTMFLHVLQPFISTVWLQLSVPFGHVEQVLRAKVTWSESSRERMFSGTKLLRSGSYRCGTSAPWSETAWERKVHKSLMEVTMPPKTFGGIADSRKYAPKKIGGQFAF